MKYLSKICITIIITLILLINIKGNSKFKTNFFNKVYSTNISFGYFNSLYEKYIRTPIKEEPVFSEKLNYVSKEKYMEGVKLSFNSLTPIPSEENGVVIYKSYDTIVIQRTDGIDQAYSNIKNSNLKLYDYVKKGEIIGEVDNDLYISYRKDGVFLDYEEYIK